MKWAQTEDGFLARENNDSKWISNQYSRQLVHKWRGEEDAILVGKNTAIHDNPSLTVREWEGEHPIRVVIDNQQELSGELHLFDNSVETLVFNIREEKVVGNTHWIKYDDTLENLLFKLRERKIQSLIVEGGSKILHSFIESELWDEARVFSSSTNFEKGNEAPPIGGRLLRDSEIAGDRLEIYEYVH